MARYIDLAPGVRPSVDELTTMLTRAELVAAAGLTRAWVCHAMAAGYVPMPCTPTDPGDSDVHEYCGWQLYVMERDL
jgi:hypothetical protein